MRIKEILKMPFARGKGPEDRASEDGDALLIDCRGCSERPDMGSPGCLRCVCRHMAGHGGRERISLRTARDTEYSGRAVEILNEVAALESMASSAGSRGGRGCGACEASCSKVFDRAWSALPRPDFDGARAALRGFRPSGEGCEACIQRTYRMLDQAETGFERICREASRSARGITEG